MITPTAMSHPNSDTDTPNGALDELLRGNARFVEGRTGAESTLIDRDAMAADQSPHAAILRCADSRVAPEIVFDQSLGSLFVCGIAGNAATDEVIGSLDYAVQVLGCKAIVVMGHTSCGAIAAAMADESAQGHIATLLDHIVIDGDDDATRAAHNAVHQASEIARRSSPIAAAVSRGELCVAAGVFDIASGRFAFTSRSVQPDGGGYDALRAGSSAVRADDS